MKRYGAGSSLLSGASCSRDSMSIAARSSEPWGSFRPRACRPHGGSGFGLAFPASALGFRGLAAFFSFFLQSERLRCVARTGNGQKGPNAPSCPSPASEVDQLLVHVVALAARACSSRLVAVFAPFRGLLTHETVLIEPGIGRWQVGQR